MCNFIKIPWFIRFSPKKTLPYTGWCPSVVGWFINHNYSYIMLYQPQILSHFYLHCTLWGPILWSHLTTSPRHQATSCHASQRLATWPPRRRPRGGTRSCPWRTSYIGFLAAKKWEYHGNLLGIFPEYREHIYI